MKRKLLLLTIALAFMGAQAFGQYQGLSQAINLVGNATPAGAQPGMPIAGQQAGLYQVTWVASGTVSTCTVKFQDSPDNVTYTDRGAVQTCTSTGTYLFQATPTSWLRINVTAQTGSGNVTYTVVAVPNTPVGISSSDGVYYVPLGACGLTLTTGTWAANANGGTSLAAGPFLLKAQTGNTVLEGTTTAAANTFDLTCDITPPTRLTTGRGVTINDVVYAYGYQTTALTTIGTATVNSVAYSAPGGAAAGTVVTTAGGTLTATVGTSHSTPGATTTSGQCYVEKQAFGTPYVATVDNQRLTLQNTFAQSAAASTILQICGVWVHYSNVNTF